MFSRTKTTKKMKRNEMIIEQEISKVVRNLLMEMAEENTADEVSTETTGNLMLDDEKDGEKFETNSEEVRHKVCDCLSDYGNIRYGFKVMKPDEIENKIRDCFSDDFDITVETNEIPKEKCGGDEMKVELTDKNNPDTKYTVYIYQTANDKLRFPGYFKIHNIHVLDDSYITPKEEEPEMDNTDKSLNEVKSLIDRMNNLA